MSESYVIKNISHKPDILSLVRSYIKSKKSYSCYGCYYDDEWDDYYDDECLYTRWLYSGGCYSPLYRTANNTGKNKSSIVFDDSPSDDDGDVDDLNVVLDTDDEGFKEIYYYSDIQLGDDPDERFSNLKELKEYCDMMGIHISNSLYESLRGEHIIHCCINPVDKKYGDVNLITDYSYGNLYWKCYDALQDDIDDTSIVGNYGDMKYNGVDLPF